MIPKYKSKSIENIKFKSKLTNSKQQQVMDNKNKKQKINNGRWTRAEHRKFMDAIDKYGKDWEKIQKKIKTRTVLQIRSHAQKIFLKMSKEDIDAFIGSDQSSVESIRNGKTQKRQKLNQIVGQNHHNRQNQNQSTFKEEKEQKHSEIQQGNLKIEQNQKQNEFETKRKVAGFRYINREGEQGAVQLSKHSDAGYCQRLQMLYALQQRQRLFMLHKAHLQRILWQQQFLMLFGVENVQK